MPTSLYNNAEYRKKQSLLTKKLWAEGKYNVLIKPLQLRHCKNANCINAFMVKPYDPKVFCSRSCSAFINNRNRQKIAKTPCLACGNYLEKRFRKYCSINCQNNHKYHTYINSWKKGIVNGIIGQRVKTTSHHIRRYLLRKYDEQCSLCGWNKKHTTTGVIPLEIDHIDGNAENNTEQNLRILCPNCHALTPNFRNLNKGHGRKWRLVNNSLFISPKR